jgi:hypothetical protein
MTWGRNYTRRSCVDYRTSQCIEGRVFDCCGDRVQVEMWRNRERERVNTTRNQLRDSRLAVVRQIGKYIAPLALEFEISARNNYPFEFGAISTRTVVLLLPLSKVEAILYRRLARTRLTLPPLSRGLSKVKKEEHTATSKRDQHHLICTGSHSLPRNLILQTPLRLWCFSVFVSFCFWTPLFYITVYTITSPQPCLKPV